MLLSTHYGNHLNNLRRTTVTESCRQSLLTRQASSGSGGRGGNGRVELVLVECAYVFVQVEFEAGTMGAEGAGVRLLPRVSEDVVSQTLVEVSPDK